MIEETKEYNKNTFEIDRSAGNLSTKYVTCEGYEYMLSDGLSVYRFFIHEYKEVEGCLVQYTHTVATYNSEEVSSVTRIDFIVTEDVINDVTKTCNGSGYCECNDVGSLSDYEETQQTNSKQYNPDSLTSFGGVFDSDCNIHLEKINDTILGHSVYTLEGSTDHTFHNICLVDIGGVNNPNTQSLALLILFKGVLLAKLEILDSSIRLEDVSSIEIAGTTAEGVICKVIVKDVTHTWVLDYRLDYESIMGI